MAEFIHSPEAVVEPGETVPIESDYISRAQVVLALLDKGQRSRRYHLGDTWELNFNEIREAIKSIPAADVRHVVRGKWISKYPLSTCSVCEKSMILCDFANFCPNCWAMMEES